MASQVKYTKNLEKRLNLDRILKSRDIAVLTKARLVKAVVFPVVMYGVRVGP